MLQQILKDMFIDPELLAELPEDQKQYLFFKMREEQVRRWMVREQELSKEEDIKKERPQKKSKKVDFITGEDGNEWVWVMGDHPNDKSIEQIIEEEAEQKALEQAEIEIRKELEKEKEEKKRKKEEAERKKQEEDAEKITTASDVSSEVDVPASEDQEEQPDVVEGTTETKEEGVVAEVLEESKVERSNEEEAVLETKEEVPEEGESVRRTEEQKGDLSRPAENGGTENGTKEEKVAAENGTEVKPQPPPLVPRKPKVSTGGVKLREKPVLSEEEQLKKMIMRRSREILFDFKSVRARFEEVAKSDGKELKRQWRTQEQKARAMEEEIRQMRQRVREEQNQKPVSETLMAVELMQACPALSPFDDIPEPPPSVTSPPSLPTSKAEAKKKEKEEKKKKEEEKKKEKEEKKKEKEEKKKRKEKASKKSEPPVVQPSPAAPDPTWPTVTAPKPPIPPRPRITRRPINRQAALNWFLRDQKPRGATIDPVTRAVAPWFLGLVTRTEAEALLEEEAPGTFGLRVSERLFGFAVSLRDHFRIKHFLIEALSEGGYRLFGVGEHRVHRSLFDFVEFHRVQPLTSFGQEQLLFPVRSTPDSPNEQPSFFFELFPERPASDITSAL